MVIALALTLLAVQEPNELRRVLAQDTSRPVRRARSAQEYFERDRRYKLPATHTGGGRCDERIGRFCYWYDDGDTSLPADPEPVKVSRSRLLETLASAQNDEPESDWLLGQRVRYLIEQGQLDSAVAVADRCGATVWWCVALGGMAHHVSHRFAEADSLFAVALSEMPESVRCDWTNWTVVLDGRLASRSDDGTCATRAALADTVLWLGQPLWSRGGNDLRTELLSRRVMASLHSVAKSPHLISWGGDMEELMLRYGWSTRYSVSDLRPSSVESPSVVGHQRSPSYHFLPTAQADSGWGSWSWDLLPTRPRARYAPAYVDHFALTTRFQIARFPRGDTTLVVGGIDTKGDTAFRSRPIDLGLSVSGGPGKTVVARRDSATRAAGVVAAFVGEPVMASVEAWPTGARRYIRARARLATIDRSGPLVLSDPLLFSVGEELPASLEQAAQRALPSTRFSKAEPVGVYWEAAGMAVDSVAIAVAVVPIRRGLLGRIGEGLSVVRRRAPLTLQWRAGSGGAAVVGRAVELDLRRLRAGKYLLRLEARTDRVTAVTEQTIELTP